MHPEQLQTDRLQLLPEWAVAEMACVVKAGVDAKEGGRGAAGRILSRSVHPPRATVSFSSSKQAGDLRTALSGGFGDFVEDCRRPEASRCVHRFSGGAAHLGANPPTPSAPALRHTWRGTLA